MAEKNRRRRLRERSIRRRTGRGTRTNRWTQKEGIHLVPGGLFGWHAHESPQQRHAALRKAIRHDVTWQTVVRRLNIEANLQENRNPDVTRIAREDLHWVQQNFGERGY